MIFVGIQCDLCERGIRLTYAPRKYIIKWGREHGWKCGKRNVCPDCAADKPKRNKAEQEHFTKNKGGST